MPLTTPRHRPNQSTGASQDDEAVSPPDLDLLLASRTDADAFGIIFERYWPLIFAYCLRRLQSPEVADDAASTVFARAFAARTRFRPTRPNGTSSVRSWLFAIAHNVVIDVWRSPRPASLDANPVAQGLTEFTPEDEAIDAEEARMVIAILNALPERQRSVVEFRLAGLTTPEVADILGLSLPATKSLQFRAYRALRDLLRTNPQFLTTRELPDT